MNSKAPILPQLFKTLQQATPPPGGVLSVYLDAGANRSPGQAYLLAFRDGCKALRSTLAPSERDVFEVAAARAERYLLQFVVPGKPGIALFSSAQEDYFYALPLSRAPTDDVSWDSAPLLMPLQEELEQGERIGVLLFDKERARLFTVVLGEIEEKRVIVDEVPGKQASGGWYALSQARYARHHQEHVLQHVKRTVTALLELLRTHPFDRLLLGGPDEAVALLRPHLPPPLRDRLSGTLALELVASEADVLQATTRAGQMLAQRAEQADVAELLEAAGGGHAVTGLEASLAALHERRVHRLVVADAFALSGAQCPRCGRLALRVTLCPDCDERMAPVPHLETRIAAQAHEQDATVTVVAGVAGERLMTVGGVGGWTYYEPAVRAVQFARRRSEHGTADPDTSR
jgi:peptide chain release factor subunit 1